jgi:hypothetical protein
LTAGHRCPTCTTRPRAIQLASIPGEEESSPGTLPASELGRRHAVWSVMIRGAPRGLPLSLPGDDPTVPSTGHQRNVTPKVLDLLSGRRRTDRHTPRREEPARPPAASGGHRLDPERGSRSCGSARSGSSPHPSPQARCWEKPGYMRRRRSRVLVGWPANTLSPSARFSPCWRQSGREITSSLRHTSYCSGPLASYRGPLQSSERLSPDQ